MELYQIVNAVLAHIKATDSSLHGSACVTQVVDVDLYASHPEERIDGYVARGIVFRRAASFERMFTVVTYPDGRGAVVAEHLGLVEARRHLRDLFDVLDREA